MQPLDITLYGPNKTAYNVECSKFMTSHPGKRITIYDQGALFGAAYLRVATMDKAVNGFRSTGLWPYNPDIFSENDFMAAAITDEPIPLQQSQPSTHRSALNS
jgi:hypothetical protein